GDLVRKTNWKEKDLPETLSLRIGVHAGPVCRCYDPIIEKWTYTGTHVCRTARIEPITPAGQVYASQAFAALAAVEKVAEFTCDYVKRAAWAKEYGTFPTYVVRRAGGEVCGDIAATTLQLRVDRAFDAYTPADQDSLLNA